MVGKRGTSLPMGGTTTIDPDDHKDRRKPVRGGNRIHDQKDPMGMMQPSQCIRNPRVLLLAACLWPFALMALMACSSPRQQQQPLSSRAIVAPELASAVDADAGGKKEFHWRSVLDRVDVMGYGPTHPRVAFVVVGETTEELIESVKSVFSNTDMRRIFVICAVLDTDRRLSGKEQKELTKKLRKIENGSVPHWHGLKRDVHRKGAANNNPEGEEDDEEDESHSPKIHVLFNVEYKKKGLAASRSDAVEFVQILAKTHEDAGFKSYEEDLILMLMQGGTKFHHHTWLNDVTSALIVPPPLYGVRDPNVAMKLANAVSFRVEALGQRTSFDTRFSPLVGDAPAADMNLSNGNSIPTPALNGAGVAMRLGTFLNLPSLVRPAAAPTLSTDTWLANLELSLNLWLCADGIDILEDVEVTPPPGGILFPQSPMSVGQVAELASAWMDDEFRERFYMAYSLTMEDDDLYKVTRLDWDTEVSKNRRLSDAQDLHRNCRTFEWYTKHVNKDLEFINDLEPDEDEDEDEDKDEKAATEPPTDELEEENGDRDEVPAIQNEEVAETKAENSPVAKTDSNKVAGASAADDGRKKPSKPLRPANLEIVQRPRPIDISFVDVSNGHKEHPHMPALDAKGLPGYIHDETALRKNPPELNYPKLKKGCKQRDDNYRMMHERIVVETEYDKKMEESGKKRDKIFCLVYTIESGHFKIPAIRETWGPKCDGFMVGSTKTDPSIGAVNIPHEGPEEYNNIWQKVRSMWSYIYDNYYEKYDWFHIGGDDLFLLVENLRYYLESEEIQTAANGGIYLPEGNETKQTPLLLGRRFAYQGDMNNIFDSGGSGYTMNKAALKLLVTEGFPNYFPHRKTFSEDTMVATLFKKINMVLPYDTKDDAGGERYMPFLPGHHYSYRLPKDPSKDWYAKYSIDIKEGPAHCSPQSVAFHYVKDDMMKRLFALAYGLCPK